VWADKREKSTEGEKPRNKEEIKEALLNVLRANRGRIMSTEDLLKALPMRKSEGQAFKEAFNELVTEGKVKYYIGSP